ncbi:MAG: transglutaminase-like domain-containing protein [Betaproteobacteria bacterium]|nr:transglutaminase-like domain-containing protein [Betaproteobacteria bacterium]
MRRLVAVLALALLSGCAGSGAFFHDAGVPPPTAPRALADWPWHEVWTGVVFRGRKVGFAHLALRPAAASGRWEIESESALRLRFLGVDKKVSLRALDRVSDDLTLESFRYEYHLDGSRLRVEGERAGDVLVVRTETSGTRTEQRLQMNERALPASALALLPAQRGLRVGDKARATVFVGESQSLAEAELRAIAYQRSPLFEGAALRVATTLLGLESDAWYDAEGRPLLETALHGAMISALEDAPRARAYLVEASLNKDESLLEFGLLRSAPIAAPRHVAALSVVLEGVPAALEMPGAGGQRCSRDGSRLACRIDRRSPHEPGDAQQAQGYLRASLAAPSNERRFLDLAQSIAGDARGAQAKIERLLAWIEANIAKEAVDAFSATDVLRERRAECQGHAYLFAALARALQLPTRVVNGVVYVAEQGGFLYHTWNEVWIENAGWRPVDATFGQPLADATHLALAVGESPAELAPLAAMVGRARVAALGDIAHW